MYKVPPCRIPPGAREKCPHIVLSDLDLPPQPMMRQEPAANPAFMTPILFMAERIATPEPAPKSLWI